MDSETTIQSMKSAAIQFRDDRNWKQFHNLKDLAAGLSIESAELLELLLWKTPNAVEGFLRSEDGRRRIGEEMADVLIFLLYLSHDSDIDLAAAVLSKLRQNARRYPLGQELRRPQEVYGAADGRQSLALMPSVAEGGMVDGATPSTGSFGNNQSIPGREG